MPPAPPRLYAHPFSSYCQKVLVALYENDTPFEYRNLEDPGASEELAALWPMKRFPILVDAGRTILEASCIIEHLQLHHPGLTRLIPADPAAALEVRMLDRFFDNYVSTPQQKVVFDHLRAEGERDPFGVAQARAMLDIAYAWLDAHMDGRTWAAGAEFSLADCGAAPFLFYAHWTHPIDARFRHVHDYLVRLMERPSFQRARDEARPFRSWFPVAGQPPD